jgi:hypothetical protein
MPSQSIDLTKAKTLTENYRIHHNTTESKGYSFRKAEVQAILDQTNCSGIRIYFGRDKYGKERLLLVGITGSIDNSGNATTDLNDIHAAAANFAEYGISTVDAPDNSNSPIARGVTT